MDCSDLRWSHLVVVPIQGGSRHMLLCTVIGRLVNPLLSDWLFGGFIQLDGFPDVWAAGRSVVGFSKVMCAQYPAFFMGQLDIDGHFQTPE